MIEAARWLHVLSWLVPIVMFFPALARWFVGRARRGDGMRVATWFTATVCAGFAFRWIVFPSSLGVMGEAEYATWLGLYVLSVPTGQALTWAIFLHE